MRDVNFVILYVDDVSKSVAFYGELLGGQAAEESPTFAMFHLPSGIMLGLWARQGVEPAASAPGGAELAFTVANAAAVAAMHADWRGRGLTIAQMPRRMDFGDTFVALDPDGHRLRVFAPV